ncbi:hypothetical protein IFM89_024093 [Coptis chinensis]|uniref:Uncharacterized protein n=1 Tax=Coptis chinensis TaxID=261450 RepID=A0A835HXP0_9MAGN|nr:hypothetical protein IFM89_024093 [Coptis chinensis]
MVATENGGSSWAWFLRFIKCDSFTSASTKRKPAGWKSMPYILGNETFERLATFGLLSNFIVYLLRHYNMDQVSATILVHIWTGTTNVAPLVGAYISDSHLGKFPTLVYSSFASAAGMVALTLTAAIPTLYPPKCTSEQHLHEQCKSATTSQLGFLCFALILLAIGAGGIRPCSLPFGVDQFDPSIASGRKGINSYFNWYYFSFTVVSILASTIVVYVQTYVSWAWGYGMPTIFMFCSIVLFFLGTRLYIYVPPGKSVFSGIVQVFVAAYKKRNLNLPNPELQGALYDPPLKGTLVSKVPLTQQFRNLNKAGIVLEGEVGSDGTCLNEWKLCSIQQIEEAKCLVKVVPIWISNVICFLAMAQQDTYTVAQATLMDRNVGHKFQIPQGSFGVVSMLTLAIWIPIYDRLIVPKLEKITKEEGGFTLLQRMGIGMIFAILSMVFAGLVEIKRRALAISHPQPDGVSPMSSMWLVPQLACVGFANAFIMIGQIEFYYKQFPEHMKSLGNSIFFCTLAGSSYLSSLLVSIIYKNTGKHGEPNWLDKNINHGRLEYFYFLIAGLGVLNFFYFLVCANRYHYKNCVVVNVEEDNYVELNRI